MHTIDFQNLTQFQSNQSFMEEVENEEASEHTIGGVTASKISAKPNFLSGQ